MKQKLRILNLEDNQNDTELIQAVLVEEGIDCDLVRVETREDFTKALEQDKFNLILADYSLPSFNGLSALKIVQEKCPDIPFILVSGAIGEELAIEILKSGATDYVLKSRLSRLVPAIDRALREAEERIERKQAEEALRKEKAFTETALNTLSDIFFVFDLTGRFLRWNKAANAVTGYTDEEISSMKSTDVFSGEDIKRVITAIEKVIKEGYTRVEASLVTKDGKQIPYEFAGSLLKDYEGNSIGICGAGRDITERKCAEEEIIKGEIELKKRVQELEEFYEMGIGRELRMIELKKEIAQLKEELAKYKKT